MPRYCAAQDCSNSVCYSGRPAHKFPSEPTLRKLWIRAARPSQPTWKPAKGDCLCTEHFEDEDYKTSPKLLQSLGLPVKQAYLKPGVVPSLFTRKRKRERHSGAVEKRRRKEIIAELLKAPAQATATLIAEEVSTSSTPSGDDTEQGPDSGHEPMHDANAGIEEPCSSSDLGHLQKSMYVSAKRNFTDGSIVQIVVTRYDGTDIQVTWKTSSRQSQTSPVLVTPRCSSPNHVPQAPLDWMLPEGLTLSPQPPVRRQPAPPPDPPQLPTINNELPSTGQEDIDYVSERKFIVFESCLDELLGNCPECTALCRITEKKIKGTCLRSNETKGSWAMELEGLKRTLLICEANGLTVGGIITDRHSMIKSFLAKWYPQIRHMFDCWHVAKGIKKRMVSAGKLKSLVGLQDWVQATVKHLYWCAESSDGAPEEILPKWTSLVGHVADLHEHADPLYPRCQHGDLGKKKWLPEGDGLLHPGLQAHEKLKSIVLSKPLLKDIPQLSTAAQTYSTECFHSTVIQFAPKSTHFGYESMQARVYVAALHFNENGDRPQATTKEGKKRFLVKRPKQTKRPIASPMKGPCTYAYVQELMKETLALNCHYPSYRAAREANCVEAPPSLSSGFERPNKDLLISNHRSRFNC
ncbi:unnamed protein product [Ixodes persulcatus]